MKDKWKRRLVGDHRDPREELAVIFGATVPATDEIQPDVLEWARSRVDVSTMSQVEASARFASPNHDWDSSRRSTSRGTSSLHGELSPAQQLTSRTFHR